MTAFPSSPPSGRRIAFVNLNREIACGEDETLFHAARRHGVRVLGACGGRGVCGSCTVRLVGGQALLDGETLVGPGKKWRRACRLKPRRDCQAEIAPRSLAPVVRAEVGAKDWLGDVTPAPAVCAVDVRVAEPSLADPRGDFERLADALPGVGAIELAAAQALPEILRANRFSARAFVRGATVVGIAPPGRVALGLAIDLGTTNVVGFLVDLMTGERLASLGIENPQVAWGADVVTRLSHALVGPDAQRELAAAAALAVQSLARDLAEAIGRREDDIFDVAVCGNTAMQHLLLGLPVGQLARAPFVAATSGALDIAVRDLGLALAPSARLHAAPGVGGFVGSDHVAALLATRARWDGDGATLVMDIGTNTEISLVSGGRIVSASCPSGPALEGGNIACGMRAAEGAIERVRDRERRPRRDDDRRRRGGGNLRLGRPRRDRRGASAGARGQERPDSRPRPRLRSPGRKAGDRAGGGRPYPSGGRSRRPVGEGRDPHRRRSAPRSFRRRRTGRRPLRARRRLRPVCRHRQRRRDRSAAAAAARTLSCRSATRRASASRACSLRPRNARARRRSPRDAAMSSSTRSRSFRSAS